MREDYPDPGRKDVTWFGSSGYYSERGCLRVTEVYVHVRSPVSTNEGVETENEYAIHITARITFFTVKLTFLDIGVIDKDRTV